MRLLMPTYATGNARYDVATKSCSDATAADFNPTTSSHSRRAPVLVLVLARVLVLANVPEPKRQRRPTREHPSRTESQRGALDAALTFWQILNMATPYNATVAARIQAASYIKSNAAVFAQYTANGGLTEELDLIIQHGRAAEAANLGQSTATGAQLGETQVLHMDFATLQRSYKGVMAIVRAVRSALQRENADPSTIAAVEQILENETPVHVKVVKGEDDKSIRGAMKRQSQEAIRAEIQKDASALLDLAPLADRLTARGVTAERLTALRDSAIALTGQVDESILSKARRKEATATENAAVRAQRQVWGGVYDILRRIDDEALAAYLKAASWK